MNYNTFLYTLSPEQLNSKLKNLTMEFDKNVKDGQPTARQYPSEKANVSQRSHFRRKEKNSRSHLATNDKSQNSPEAHF
jgi:hypothetical protein